eukprot:3365043-Prymnesium_polylepis.3
MSCSRKRSSKQRGLKRSCDETRAGRGRDCMRQTARIRAAADLYGAHQQRKRRQRPKDQHAPAEGDRRADELG